MFIVTKVIATGQYDTYMNRVLRKKYLLFILLSCLAVTFIFLARNSAFQHGAFYDDALYLSSGFSLLKNQDYSLNFEHPPLYKKIMAIPLLFCNLKAPQVSPMLNIDSPDAYLENCHLISRNFLYYNRVPSQVILRMTRWVNIFFLLLFGVCLFFIVLQLGGGTSAFIFAILYFFHPVTLSLSYFYSLDTGLFVFQNLALASILLFLRFDNKKYLLAGGFFMGLAMASREQGLALIPFFVVYLIYFYIYNRDKNNPIDEHFIIYLAGMVLIALLVLYSQYGPFDFAYYLKGLQYQNYRLTGKLPFQNETILFGKISFSGFWSFGILSFLLTNSLSFLVLFLLSLYEFIKNYSSYSKNFLNICQICLALFIVFLLLLTGSKIQAVRYLYSAYPCLFIFISLLIPNFLRRNKLSFSLIAGILFIWYIINTLSLSPFYSSAAIEIIGSKNISKFIPENDFGQNLPFLSEYVHNKNIHNLILAYYGTDLPEAYNLKCHIAFYSPSYLFPKNNIQISVSQLLNEPVYFATTELINSYYDIKVSTRAVPMARILQEIKPQQQIANSIYLYDITKNYRIYFLIALMDLARRDYTQSINFLRAITLGPQNDFKCLAEELILAINDRNLVKTISIVEKYLTIVQSEYLPNSQSKTEF